MAAVIDTDAIDLEQKFSKFFDYWSPKVVAELNDYQLKLVKFQGDFVWHSHPDTDEVFLVTKGAMEILFRDRTIALTVRSFILVVPRITKTLHVA